MVSNKSNPVKNSKRSQYILALILFVILLIVGAVFWALYMDSSNNQPQPPDTESSETTQERQGITDEVVGFNAVQLQQVIESWDASFSGTASVVIRDESGNILAAKNPDELYFAASIYKLYVAYAGYQQVDSRAVDPDAEYINGYSRLECLDVMIRDSNSPCAEKLWNELGKIELTNQLATYGITNTSMEAITTTANDASILLGRMLRGEGLSDDSRIAFLDSMKDQEELYRRGLPSGFTQSTVFNKVGWNEQVEWHDTAIVKFADGRYLIVSVMTENVGFQKVLELGRRIEDSVLSYAR
jgi:hypothetical protein